MRPSDAGRLVALGAIWGSSYMFIKIALEGYGTLQIVGLRLIIGALVLLALVYGMGLRLPTRARTWRLLAIMAVVGNLVPFLLITWGEEEISSSLAAILNSTTPLFTALLAAAFIAAERLTGLRVAGIVLGFAGVATIVGLDIEVGSLPSEMAMILAAAAYGVGFVFARRYLLSEGEPPLVLAAGQIVVSSVLMIPAVVVEWIVSPPTIGFAETASVLVLGAVGTGAAYYIYYRLVDDLGATTASFSIFLIPLFGIVWGALILDESLGWGALGGALLVVGGIGLETLARRSGATRPVTAEEPRPAL